MKVKNNRLSILFLTLCIISCNKKSSDNEKNSQKYNKENFSEKSYIPKDLKIEKEEYINIDTDSVKEVLITATDSDANYAYEFWFKNKELLYKFKYPWGSINKKWFINLDEDSSKEIIRIQGYEDGVDYVIYDIQNKKQIPLLYFNPILLDKKYPNKNWWAFPYEIENIISNNKNEIQVSFDNFFQRDDEHFMPKDQNELPFVFFNGNINSTEQKPLKNIKPGEFISLKDLLIKIKKKNYSDTFIGKFTVSVEGDYTNHGREMYNYEINILENEISLHETNLEVCSGRYRGKENNNTLELFYVQDSDERCEHIKASYTIKKEGGQFYIQGVGGEGTYNDWTPLKKVTKFEN